MYLYETAVCFQSPGAEAMDIELESNQIGVIGDFVPSTLGAAGKKHFVTPKLNTFGMADYTRLWQAWVLSSKVLQSITGVPIPIPLLKPDIVYATDVTLKASNSANFVTKFKWENATPVSGSPHLAKVSRRVHGKSPVQIKELATGKVVAELNVWVVWSNINAIDATPAQAVGPFGTGAGGGFLVSKGFAFTHTIKPASIITPGSDRPDFQSGTPAAAPPTGGLNYKGDALSGGVNSKWDGSRIVRQKTINPKGVSLLGDASFNSTFPDFPSLSDGDGRPGGAKGISFEDWLVVGNDDAWTGEQDNNPYDAQTPNTQLGRDFGDHTSMPGTLTGFDTPSRGILNSQGSDGDTVEWRLHFQEFTRLDINGKWYLISDHFPWRVHYKLKKVSGKWKDDGSNKAKNNQGF
jgi:hypothetical protein